MIRRKKSLIVILAILLLAVLGFSSVSRATDEVNILPPGLDEFDIRILNNGNYIKSSELPIEKDKNIILSPLRVILESSGYTVDWEKNGVVNIDKDGENYKFDSKNSKYKMENHNGNIMVEQNYFKEIKGLKVTYDMLTRTLVVKSDYKDGDVYDYDLGKRTMKTSLNRDLNYRLNGSLMTPETDKNPLVIILHGAHGATKAEENRFDLGYSYLMKELVKENYTVVAPNITIQYSFEDGEPMGNERLMHLFEETLLSLQEANKGSNNFGIDLKNKIDFNKIILIGHSRSGYEIFELNNKYKNDDRIKIKGLLSIAPARMSDAKFDEVDNPAAVILPELDGDVFGLEGQSMFDEIIDNDKRKSDAQLVYLYGANHNAFNESLLIQDAGNIFYEGNPPRMKEDKQRDFLVKYSKAYTKAVFENNFISDDLKASEGKILGYNALVSNYAQGYNIYKAQNGLKDIIASNVDISPEIASFNKEISTVGLFNHPGDAERLELLNIKWKALGGELKFKLEESTKDKKQLSLYLAQDSTDPINKKENQSFTVVLKDSKGKSSSLLIDNKTEALKFVDGTPEFEGKLYSTHTPLSILDIDLSKFKDIDTDDIKEVILKFDQTNAGSIFLRFIEFK